MVNVDPVDGSRHKAEPDGALRRFREIDEGAPRYGCLGMQLCPIFSKTSEPQDLQAFIEVGMGIDVIETGPHFYIEQ